MLSALLLYGFFQSCDEDVMVQEASSTKISLFLEIKL